MTQDYRGQHEEFASVLLTAQWKAPRKRKGDKVVGRCPLPGHEDKNPSFSYDVSRGSWVCSCGSGKGSDLMKDLNWTPSTLPPRNGNAIAGGPSEELHFYSNGNRKVRPRLPNGDKGPIRWEHAEAGSWAKGISGDVGLYKQADVEKSPTILLSESESDVDALVRLGLPSGYAATCTGFGAESPIKPDKAALLRGKKTFILEHQDDPGRRYSSRSADIIAQAGGLAWIVKPPPGCKDIRDYIKSGGTTDGVLALIDAAVKGVPAPSRTALQKLALSTTASPTSQNDAWLKPVAFSGRKLPTIERGVLPEWLDNWARAVSTSIGVSADAASTVALGYLAAACAKKFKVQIKADWSQQVSLYLAVVLDSGEGKTPIFTAAEQPIRTYMDEMRPAWTAAYASQLSTFNVAKQAADNAEKEAARAEGDDVEVQQKREGARRLREDFTKMRAPAYPKLISNDVTTQEITRQLSLQRGRLAIASPEGGMFNIYAGLYSDGVADLDIVLKGDTGEPHDPDRKTSVTYPVRHPVLTHILGIQPCVLEAIGDKREFRGRGLLARFFFCIPESMVGTGRKQYPAPAVPVEVSDVYKSKMLSILRYPETYDETGEPEATILVMEPDAATLFWDFSKRVDDSMAKDGELANLKDWGSKLSGKVLRFAALIHIAESMRADSTLSSNEISCTSMLRAIELADFFKAHTKAAFEDMGIDEASRGARDISAWLQEKQVARFRKTDVWERFRGRAVFKKSKSVLDSALALLETYGHIRGIAAPATPAGKPGRPPVEWEVNPELLEPARGDTATPTALDAEDAA